MLKPVITRKLSHGVAHINWDGMVILEQGRPHGVMANPGECMLTVKDLGILDEMIHEFLDKGNEILGDDVVRAL